MNDNLAERLRFLKRVVEREIHHRCTELALPFLSPSTAVTGVQV